MEDIKMTTRKRAGKIYDVFLGEMHLFTASQMVADPICDSFNEYDTLKDEITSTVMLNESLMAENTRLQAKAELLDEAITALKGVHPIIDHKYCKQVDKVLSKAKELSK